MATHSPGRGHAKQLTGRRGERDLLDRLIEAVRAGESRALVVVGEPGVGKTALLDYLAGQARGCRVTRAVGVQSEMELAFAGLHQLCAPMLDHLERLPVPQREALRIAFGLSAGPAPDRFLVGLAVLSLLSEVAAERPLVCLVDDEQWLDRASAQVLGFVARRLEVESVGVVFTVRTPAEELAGLPELAVGGLAEGDARALLDAALAGPLDARIRDRIVAETRGNPLALLEFPRVVKPAGMAGGFGLPGAAIPSRVEEAFGLRVDALPAQTRRLLQLAAAEVWDDASWHALAAREVQVARDTGALVHLQSALDFLARTHLLAGELAAAARLIDEDRLIAEATGNAAVAYTPMALAAWRGQEARVSELTEATVREATARGMGRPLDFAAYASSVLGNGLGRHDAARDAAWRAFESDQLGYGPFVVPELAEAASRTGDTTLVEAALAWLSERTRVTPTEWVLGIEARVQALLSEGEAAESRYRESIERLARTRVRAQLARGHLLYGEWLRRERRRADARVQLRTAHDMLDAMGIGAFAERARRELAATGETARKRTVETVRELTAQEAQIARLARDGLSNPQIGARLFLSPRTVQYHLGNVFAKLDIGSRNQLRHVLASDPDTLRSV